MNIKKFKGTPGPWKICRANNCWVEGKNGKVDIAYTDMNCPDDECVCNARLIAAAPELLEALDRLVELIDSEGEGLECGMPTPEQWYDARNKAEAAIMKALGE